MQKRPFFGSLLLADKNAKTRKRNCLNWSVWEAQAKGISSTSLRDTVSPHTASESTRFVLQSIKKVFLKF
jgi:hypothetical protein